MSTNHPSKSDNIRQLHKEGKSISEISKLLNISYQHAYNVVNKHNNQGAHTQPTIEESVNSKTSDVSVSRSRRKSVGTIMFSRINYQVNCGMKELYLLRNLPEA